MVELEKIIQFLKPTKVIGRVDLSVEKVVSFDEINLSQFAVSWINSKNVEKLYTAKSGIIICPASIDETRLPSNCTFMLFETPRKAFMELLTFFDEQRPEPCISSSAIIGKNVKIGKNVFIGHHTVIENDVIICDNVIIYHNNSIMRGTIIKDNVKIGSNNSIGGVGFGYEKNEEGNYVVLPHIGGVIIEENVEIGNNTCIDRAVLGHTILKNNSKIDNLVHIAHGVVIGENSLVIAHAMVGGSAIIGKNVWVAPNSSLINKVSVGDNSTIGLGAVVIRNVGENEIVIGNPAKLLTKKT